MRFFCHHNAALAHIFQGIDFFLKTCYYPLAITPFCRSDFIFRETVRLHYVLVNKTQYWFYPVFTKARRKCLKERLQPAFTGRVAVLGGIFLGGKDVNATELANAFPDYIAHQTTSGLLRSYPEAAALMQKRVMVPNAVVYKAVDSYLASLGYPKGLLANGWVRVVRQARRVHDMLKRAGYYDIRFIEFQVNDDEELEARRKKRWGELHRPDDEYRVAWKGIRAYRRRSAAILKACEDVGYHVIRIDAGKPLADVQRQFAQAFVR